MFFLITFLSRRFHDRYLLLTGYLIVTVTIAALLWYLPNAPPREYDKKKILIVCFTSYFAFSIAVLSHSPGEVDYHLLLRQETRIPRVAPFSFQIGIRDHFVNRGQKSYTPTAFGMLWTTPGVRCMKHASS